MENEAIQFAYFIADELNNYLNITNLILIFLTAATILGDYLTLKELSKRIVNKTLKEFKIGLELN